MLLIPFLRRWIGEVLVRSNLGSNQIDMGHCTWPRGAPTEPLGVEPVWIKVSVKLIFSLVPSEEEKDDHDEGKDTDGTSNNTTGDSGSIRRRPSTTTAIRRGREDELGGPHCLRLDLTVRVSGSGNHVKNKKRVSHRARFGNNEWDIQNDRAEHKSRG